MHHLLVWAVAGATGGGGLRSVCVSVRGRRRGRGAPRSPPAQPKTGLRGRGGRRPPGLARPCTVPPPPHPHTPHPLLCKGSRAAFTCLASPGAVSNGPGSQNPPRRRDPRPRLPVAVALSRARCPQPPPPSGARCRLHLAQRDAVSRTPQSPSNHNGVRMTGRTSRTPASQSHR
jgi:hypothetical protein